MFERRLSPEAPPVYLTGGIPSLKREMRVGSDGMPGRGER